MEDCAPSCPSLSSSANMERAWRRWQRGGRVVLLCLQSGICHGQGPPPPALWLQTGGLVSKKPSPSLFRQQDSPGISLREEETGVGICTHIRYLQVLLGRHGETYHHLNHYPNLVKKLNVRQGSIFMLHFWRLQKSISPHQNFQQCSIKGKKSFQSFRLWGR